MTDTDKLKRLALHLADEAIWLSMGPNPVSVQRANEAEDNSRAILALIAENEALRDYGKSAAQEAVQYRRERDGAVALLRTCLALRDDGDAAAEHWDDARGFLDKMDREAQ